MLRRLRFKFVAIIMAVVLTVLFVMFFIALFITFQDIERESARAMRAAAAEPFRFLRPGEERVSASSPYFVVQINEEGEPVSAVGYYDLTDKEYLNEIVSAAMESGKEKGKLKEYRLRFYFGENESGKCVAFMDMSSEGAVVWYFVRTWFIIGGASTVAFFAISVFLSRWAVAPVERAWEQQRQFVTDASHELKTPLTVITTNAELLRSAGQTESGREQCAGNILTMAQQMRGLVGSLLDLASVENDEDRKPAQRVDISELLEDAMLSFEPLFFERELTAATDLERGINVMGDKQELRHVADVLLDNALKYSTAPGTVTVELRRQGRRCLFSVATPGEEMTKQELQDIFKRFYRADKARRMNESYGLGLAIAYEIVSRHRGKIWAESGEGVNTFFVELPTAA